MSLRCKLFGHKADRGGARHDNQDYWTRCVRCNARLIRDIDDWREPTNREVLDHEFNIASQRADRGQRDAETT
ncbi:DUF1660 family phage protein [Sphingomonas zeicaulis]|uniref:DUF1660 family phage protein n=1 Tax=Sphingomonas zeicaulis TaxID=1632740 RepID=UPI003D1987C7